MFGFMLMLSYIQCIDMSPSGTRHGRAQQADPCPVPVLFPETRLSRDNGA
jgi:hypothetical protein